ncbi:receptor kinase At4g00960 [Olea europaea subsp. europaea]|uniref:non-specific serine/threonine protein kinase n=1 Tax=Olea europaea subsp. europaea TaxID=158383 RepID=A0A8S0V4T5_OLEEU|nr:receptor kinase At4g00960 [Olea europaea subsp. europaea]
MSSGKCLAFIFLSLTNFLPLVKSQSHWCLNNGSYTSNSTYKTNLDTLLSSISSNIDGNGFYNASNGENSDRVNAMALCRGDLQLDACRSCINNATNALLQLCPHQKEAIFWDESGQCMLRYSKEPIFGKLATYPLGAWYVLDNTTSPEKFNRDLRTLLDSLRSQAAYGGAFKKFAAANATGPDLLTIYGLAQCTPDLNSHDCSDCLIRLLEYISRCCSGRPGFASHCPSFLRCETYLFYDDTPQPAPPPPLQAPSGKDDNTTQTIIIVVVPIIVGLIVVLCIGIFLRVRQNHKSMEKLETHNEIRTLESLYYDFDTIRAATDNFSDANMLEQGGCGIVYKGKLQSGQQIAVKRLTMISGLGDLEFKNEVLLAARLQYKNLVMLLGFSSEGSDLFLIYEFVENGSLDHFLFDPINRSNVDWDRRYTIIRGVAKGILYLQENSRLRIIHCDLKASNILLDGEINPKILDFGMIRYSSKTKLMELLIG